jgi:hypothetical protein
VSDARATEFAAMDDPIAFLNARLDEIASRADATFRRALREVAVQRAILAKYERGRRMYNPDTGDWFSPAAAMFGSDMEWLIRTLTVIHSDHPDYRQEWRPAP